MHSLKQYGGIVSLVPRLSGEPVLLSSFVLIGGNHGLASIASIRVVVLLLGGVVQRLLLVLLGLKRDQDHVQGW